MRSNVLFRLPGAMLLAMLLLGSGCGPHRNYEAVGPDVQGLRAVCWQGKWGFINADNDEVVLPLYDSVHAFSNGYAAVFYAGRWGFIDRGGQVVIPFRFDEVRDFEGGHAIVDLRGKDYLLDAKGTLEYGPFTSLDTICGFTLGRDTAVGRSVLIFFSGERAIQSDWLDNIYLDREEGMMVVQKGQEWNIARVNGLVYQAWFDSAGYHEPYVPRVKHRKSAFETILSAVLVIPFIIDEIVAPIITGGGSDAEGGGNFYVFGEGSVPVKKNGQWGLAGTDGQMITDFKYDRMQPLTHGLALFLQKGRWGCVNKKGEEVMPAQYRQILVEKKFLIARRQGLFGLYTKKGEKLLDEKYESIRIQHNGLIYLENTGWDLGVADRNGKLVSPCKYFSIDEFREGMAVVYADGKNGFIDSTGRESIPLIYTDASHFSEGLAAVEKDGKYGYINIKGEVIIPFQYEYAGYFDMGKAAVEINGERKTINKKGQVVADP